MPKTLSPSDPHLQTAVKRLKRVLQAWGLLLLGLGLLTQWAAAGAHPMAGVPLLVVGLLALLRAEPALLAAVAAVVAFSIIPTINPRLTLLGPDPIRTLIEPGWLESAALVLGKALVTLTAANQFFLYRLLYGTERASTEDPSLPLIPPVVANGTNALARWARLVGALAAGLAALAVVSVPMDPTEVITRLLAEVAGGLAVLAAGLGLGAAFAPTDERRAALAGVGLSLVAYLTAAFVLLRLPG
jgi:hypothetical protein